MSEFLQVFKLQMAANFRLAAELVKMCGVQSEQETDGVRDKLGSDDLLCGVRGNRLDCGADTMRLEPYGITRHPDCQNVLAVNFEHFRTVRDVRRKLYGDRRSPLAGREVKP